ncbi:uncharacterized protein DS421_8g242330 [Arachis hypogaea]|nr:uncharacterized protein DS421_8g242330 [Arachis hypogaea]
MYIFRKTKERKKRRKGREEWGTVGKGKKGERRRTASAGVTAAAPPCRTDEGERRGGSSLPPPWHPSARVITASFVGSLPPNPFLPPPLESQTGEGEDAGQCREEERDPLHNAAPPCCCRRRAPMVAAGKIQRERSSRKEKDRQRRFCLSGRASIAFHHCRSATVHRAAPRHVAAGNRH